MPTTSYSLTDIQPTACLRGENGRLEQLIRVSVNNAAQPAAGKLQIDLPDGRKQVDLPRVPAGDSEHDVFIPEPRRAIDVRFTLTLEGGEPTSQVVSCTPPRRWTLHVCHLSHHDVGYTDLPSNVLVEQAANLDGVIDMVEQTAPFGEDAQTRIVVEQAWSLMEFFRRAAPARAKRMGELLRSGHVELTALFGNMVTDSLGHEEMIRAAYPSFRIAREHGARIVSAQHNDVPGISWGLCRLLADAGVKILCPGLPQYYKWGGMGLAPMLDYEKMFGGEIPGAFWWESPDGKRVLFWENNWGACGPINPHMTDVPARLAQFERGRYPYDVIRWPVIGGFRDNSPYIIEYAQNIRDWNRRWAWPRLISSTNARFYEDFVAHTDDLPTFRGALPDQDFPIGTTSTARPTAVARRTHADLQAAETLAVLANAQTDYVYPHEAIDRAYEELLRFDEHTWGFHFPAGSAVDASETFKATRAHSAAAITYDVSVKATARIADSVQLEGEDYHLVVFNPLDEPRSDVVCAAMREPDNCTTTMTYKGEGDRRHLTGAMLGHRSHETPEGDLLDGKFRLVDVETGREVPFQMIDIVAEDAEPEAARRAAAGLGGRRYGFFEFPLGLRRELRFVAEDVPAMGYRTYRLEPAEEPGEYASALSAGPDHLENEFYRVTVDPERQTVTSILDKESSREMLDADCPHAFGEVIVRRPDDDTQHLLERTTCRIRRDGPVCATLEIVGAVKGHPRVVEQITLYAGVRRIDLAVRFLKDATGLLDVHVALPLQADRPRFRYDACLAPLEPVRDYFPGAFWDTLAVGDWIRLSDGDRAETLVSALDAPIAELGELWDGHVSPAHSSIVAPRSFHDPIGAERITHGWVYSDVLYNNFGTNFAINQPGEFLFRYRIGSGGAGPDDAAAIRFGRRSVCPLTAILTRDAHADGPERTLPPTGEFLGLDNDSVRILTLKRAEDGRGWIVRLWNTTDAEQTAGVTFRSGGWQRGFADVRRTDAVERDCGETLEHSDGAVRITLAANELASIRVVGLA